MNGKTAVFPNLCVMDYGMRMAVFAPLSNKPDELLLYVQLHFVLFLSMLTLMIAISYSEKCLSGGDLKNS